MFRRILLTLGAAAALALGLVIGSAVAASASTTSHTWSHDIAGYQTARWTRYAEVSVKLPSNNQCAQAFTSRSPAGDGVAITLGPAEESNAGVPLTDGAAATLGVSFVPSLEGCGLISPSFASNLPGYSSADQFGAGAVTLNPGDVVDLSLYYSQGGQFTQAVIVDVTSGTRAHSSFDGPATYVGSSVSAGFGPYTPVGAKAKLWAVKPVAVTTYTGVHGNLASFKPQQIIMTSDGTPAGATFAWPGALWGGSNFSVFGR